MKEKEWESEKQEPFSVSFDFSKKYSHALFSCLIYAEWRDPPRLHKFRHTHSCFVRRKLMTPWIGSGKWEMPFLYLILCQLDFRRLNMTPQDSSRRTVTPCHRVLWICWGKVITLWLPQSFLVSAFKLRACNFARNDLYFFPTNVTLCFDLIVTGYLLHSVLQSQTII